MTRTITVTGGFSGSVTVDLTDSLGQLADASLKIALTPVGQDDPPAVGNAAWKTASGTQSASRATVSAVVDASQPVGDYNIAYDVEAGGQHEGGWVMDRRNPRARALVVVT